MSDIVPRIDTIEFDELVEQARADIPRYAPDWTDHNLHDPGMTLIDLLAWIVDQQVFRAGFVGGRHRTAFAALLGRQATGPTPAQGLIWPDRPVREGRFVAVGSDVVCQQHVDLDFALAWDHPASGALYIPPVRLVGVGRTLDGVALAAPSASVSAGGGGGSWTLGASGRMADTAVSLQFDGPLGATGPVRVALGIDVAPPPGPAPAPGDREWGPVTFTYRAGTDRWVELDVVHDGTAGLASTGVVVLAVPPTGGATGSSELRLEFARGFFPVAPQIRAVNVNVLPIVQRRREAPAKLGDGNGQPDQEFALDTTDLVGAPEIRVGGQVWQKQTDFARSGPDRPPLRRPPRSRAVRQRRQRSPPRPGRADRGRRADAHPRRGGQPPPRPVVVGARARAGHLRAEPPVARGRSRSHERRRPRHRGPRDRRRARALLTDAKLVAAARGLTGMAVGRAEVVARFDRRLGDRRIDGVRTLVVLPYQPAWTGDSPPGSQCGRRRPTST